MSGKNIDHDLWLFIDREWRDRTETIAVSDLTDEGPFATVFAASETDAEATLAAADAA